jgi:hypothetical protein
MALADFQLFDWARTVFSESLSRRVNFPSIHNCLVGAHPCECALAQVTWGIADLIEHIGDVGADSRDGADDGHAMRAVLKPPQEASA